MEQVPPLLVKDLLTKPVSDGAVLSRGAGGLPKISVVTPSLNQGRFLERTIQSVLNQNYPNVEYIVIDGGSTDGSIDVIRRYERWLAYWVTERDSGQSEAIAKGFSRATGEVLGWLNSDDVYLPGALWVVAEFFAKNASASIVYGDCLVIDEDDVVIRKICPPPFDRNVFLFEHPIISQPAAFWRREAYDRVGGVNRKWQFCMDYDLWARFMLAGFSFTQLRVPLAGFRWHRDAKTTRLANVNQRERLSIVTGIVNRSISWRDRLTVPLLRIKRYAARPEGLTASAAYYLHKPGRFAQRRRRGT